MTIAELKFIKWFDLKLFLDSYSNQNKNIAFSWMYVAFTMQTKCFFFWRMEKENEITTNEFAVFSTKSHSNCTAELMTFATLFGTLTLCQSEKMNWQEPCRCFENVVSSLNLCVHIYARPPVPSKCRQFTIFNITFTRLFI